MHIKKFIKEREWSMGSGQCPDCEGGGIEWVGHPAYANLKTIGHTRQCRQAKMMKEIGLFVLYKGTLKKTDIVCSLNP